MLKPYLPHEISRCPYGGPYPIEAFTILIPGIRRVLSTYTLHIPRTRFINIISDSERRVAIWTPGTGAPEHFTWACGNSSLRRFAERKQPSHVQDTAPDEITDIFTRRLFLFARQLGPIRATCCRDDARLRSLIELVDLQR